MNQEYSDLPSAGPIYSATDAIYAWLCFLLAFLFWQVSPVTEHPLGGFLLILAIYITGFIVLAAKKVKLSPTSILSAIFSLIIAGVLILSESSCLLRLAYTYCLASYGYFLYAAFGNTAEKGFSNYIYLEYILH